MLSKGIRSNTLGLPGKDLSLAFWGRKVYRELSVDRTLRRNRIRSSLVPSKEVTLTWRVLNNLFALFFHLLPFRYLMATTKIVPVSYCNCQHGFQFRIKPLLSQIVVFYVTLSSKIDSRINKRWNRVHVRIRLPVGHRV